jgi:Zn-dependent peptidase ImmA (M78 family)
VLDVEAAALEIRARANLASEDLPGSVDLARALGVTVRHVDPKLLRGSDACSIRLRGRPEIFVARKMSDEKLHWLVAHEISEIYLADIGYREPDVELQADGIAARLVMPTPMYRVAVEEHGLALAALASDFLVDQTAAAIRLAEVEAVDLAVVVTPERVYARAPGAWPLPSEPEIRRGSLVKVPGMKPIRLTDAKRRVAFVLR